MSEIVNWSNATSGRWSADSKHQESQQEFICSLEKAVFNMLNQRANDFKKIFETRLSKETMSQLENLGTFNLENLALAKNYTVIGSDFHGDLFSLYGFLVLCGYLIPDPNRTLLMNFETGEVLINSNDPAKQKSIEEVLKQYDKENKRGVLTLLPGFQINPDFRGKIKLVGDYLDRGCENAMCLALLDFLTQQENYNEHLDVHLGNHETFAWGDKCKTKEFKTAISRMRKNKQITLGSMEKLGDNKYISYAHCALIKRHVPKIFEVLKKLSELENCKDKNKEPFKTQLENYKKFMSGDKEYEEYNNLVDKIKKIDFAGHDNLCNINNFKATIKYLEEIGFDVLDYFRFKTLFEKIFGDFGNIGKDGDDNYIPKEVAKYYNRAVCALGSEGSGINGALPWIFFDRITPGVEEIFETVSQIKGHDADSNKKMPYVAGKDETIADKINVICVDNFRSSGYRYDNSSVMLLIKPPYDDGDVKNNFLIEEFNVARNNYKILKDKIGKTQNNTFMSKSQKSDEKIKKRSKQGDKKFNSAQKFVAAYMSDFILRKLGFDEGIKLLKKIFLELNNGKNKSQDELDKKFNILFGSEIKIFEKEKTTETKNPEETTKPINNQDQTQKPNQNIINPPATQTHQEQQEITPKPEQNLNNKEENTKPIGSQTQKPNQSSEEIYVIPEPKQEQKLNNAVEAFLSYINNCNENKTYDYNSREIISLKECLSDKEKLDKNYINKLGQEFESILKSILEKLKSTELKDSDLEELKNTTKLYVYALPDYVFNEPNLKRKKLIDYIDKIKKPGVLITVLHVIKKLIQIIFIYKRKEGIKNFSRPRLDYVSGEINSIFAKTKSNIEIKVK